MRERQSNLGKFGGAARRKVKSVVFALSDVERQIDAIRKIGQAGNPDDIPMLVQCLDTTYHQTIRTEAALALGGIKSDRAIPNLIAALEDHAPPVQKAAATALGQLGDQRAVTSLVSLLKHPNESIRSAAADAAVNLGPEAIGWIGELLKKSSFEIRVSAASALGQIHHDRSFFALETALGDTDSIVRREVAAALAGQGRQYAERLCGHLSSENPLVRQTAAMALQKMRAPQSVELLVNHLNCETQADIREIIWKALAGCRWEPALRRGVVKDAIEAGNFERAERGGADAVSPLIELFRGGESALKKTAEASLLRIGLAGQEALSHALSDHEQPVRRLAARVLTQLGWVPCTENDFLRLKIAAGTYAEVCCPAAIPLLLERLSDPSETEREAAAETLGHTGDPAALEALAKAASDHSSRVRIRTAYALANFQTEHSRQILERLTQDTDYNVVGAARATLRGTDSSSRPEPDF